VEDSGQGGVLRRKLRPAPVRRVRDAALDAWRRTVPRLAAEGIGLELVVAGFQEREMDLHGELSVEEGALLLYLAGPHGDPAGLAVVDPGLLAGLIEVLTTGRVTATRREPRRATAVDAALAGHVIDGWLAGVAEARGDGSWLPVGEQPPELRAALLKLEEGTWTETRVEFDLAGGRRTGRLSLFLPAGAARHAPAARPGGLRPVLMPVETELEAVLCRVRVPLGTVTALAPGQLIPLPGVSLRRIALEAPRGRLIAEVHLGQSGGFRAVRVIDPAADDAAPAGTGRGSDAATPSTRPGAMPMAALDPDILPPLPDIGLPGSGGIPPFPDAGVPGEGRLPPLPGI
jgi:flagellar motor switch protein FliM